MESPHLSIVIPAYNEAARIAPTLRAVSAWLARQSFSGEIVVVDDGSTDGTGELVRILGATLGDIRLIESRPNRGKGHVVREGMLAARGVRRLFMDADHSTPIDELPALVARLEMGADVAIGSRRAPGASAARTPPWYRRVWSRLANRVVRAGLIDGIRDTQCGFKLFSREAAEAIFPLVRTAGWGFDLEVLALARRMGLRIDEVPVRFFDDPRSRIRPLRDAVRITREFFRIRRALRTYPMPAAARC
jgi:dolichyl-phosphate beta-glucosyltransferase